MANIAGDYSLRCRKCEGKLSRPIEVDPAIYGLVPNKHGAVLRRCLKCWQLWLGYIELLPDKKMKIIQKCVDRVL